MEATLLSPAPAPASAFPSRANKSNEDFRSVRSRSSFACPSTSIRCGIAEPSGQPAPMGQKTKYKDSFFDRAFMSLFARKMANVTGTSGKISGYEDFVDVSREVMKGRNPSQQKDAVRRVLLSILPPGAPATVMVLSLE